MKCPDCNQKYQCPCESCISRKPILKPWIRTNLSQDRNDWDESCPNCGVTKNVHEWNEEEYRQYEFTRNKKNT